MGISKVHCPGCQLPLRVPVEAAGRTARCPTCRTAFVIPKPDDIVEETISTWIEEDLDQELTENQKNREQQLREIEAQRKALDEQKKRERRSGPFSAGAAPAKDKDHPLGKPQPIEPAKTEHTHHPATATASHAPMQTHTHAHTHTHAPPRVEHHKQRTARAYPAELRPTAAVPHLVVESCSQEGVLLAFDSAWLEHDGFRVSLPLRCMFSGESDRAKLFGRPLAFVDRSQAALRSADELEQRYERRLGDEPTHQWIAIAGIMEKVPKPFNHPMPYYVTQEHRRQSLACTTVGRADGGITCRVLIPDGHYALDWVANVNGVCGPEHAMLAGDLDLFWSEAWRNLPDEGRRRIGVWCAFGPQEHFKFYALDADFKRADVGLAGVVITDQRLIYCKYHHRGQVPLDEEGVLHAQVQGEFAELTLVHPDRRVRVGKLLKQELAALAGAMKDAKGLKFERAGG